MKTLFLLLTALCLTGPFELRGDVLSEPTTVTYHVRQRVTLSDIPAGAKSVKMWISIPQDDRFQEVLDFSLKNSPGTWSIIRELDHGNRFMLVEVPSPGASALTSELEFIVRRKSVFVDLDPALAGVLTETHRQMFVEELRRDAPHMEVTEAIAKMADAACGKESNLVVQAKLLLNAVADYADHYSKDPSKPKCGIGDAGDCMTNAGGCCTDMHSLFIALARSRGIPTRLQMGYRLREVNDNKEVDPGYRCWVEYFIPAYGWVPADIVEADDPKGLGRAPWFSGLNARRLWLNEGREFNLAGRSVTERRVNTMIIGYAEIDGVEARVLPEADKPAQLSRSIWFTEVKGASSVNFSSTR